MMVEIDRITKDRRNAGGAGGLRGRDRRDGDLVDDKRDVQPSPEGLERDRKGPLGPTQGRRGANNSRIETAATRRKRKPGRTR